MDVTFSLSSRILLAATVLGSAVALGGCAPVLVSSAAVTTASVASDPRTAGQQLEDKEIELRAANIIQTQFGSELADINASSLNGVVLLTGSASDDEVRNSAVRLISKIPNVKSVIDRVVIGPRLSFTQVTADTWLASKVKTTLLATRGIPSGSVKVTVYNGNVYLQGIVTEPQAEDITKTVSTIDGVKEVFTLFDIRSAEELNRAIGTSVSSTPQSEPGASSTSGTATQDTGSGAVTVSPVTDTPAPQAQPI